MRTAIITTPRFQVVHANALHGSLAWGFPAPPAWTGLMTALNLKFKAADKPWSLEAVTVLPYAFHDITYRTGGDLHFSPPRAPLGRKGDVQGIQDIQGGYANLEVAFAFKVTFPDSWEEVSQAVISSLLTMRFAGGSLFPTRRGRSSVTHLSENPEDDESSQPFRPWALSSVLTLRPDLLEQHQKDLSEQGNPVSKLEAWLDVFAVRAGTGQRPVAGWLVPVTTGYQSVSPLYAPNELKGVRDSQTPFRFAESIWTVGEWVSPFQLGLDAQVFFRPDYNPQTGTYRCVPESCHV